MSGAVALCLVDFLYRSGNFRVLILIRQVRMQGYLYKLLQMLFTVRKTSK